MRLVFISDTHTHRDLAIPEGDVLVHAGDATSTGTAGEVEQFLQWFDAQPHRRRLFIAGNHDWLFQRDPDLAALLLARHPGITYLQDAGVAIDGLRFYGSPWQPEFCQWAFNLPRRGRALREAWARIPEGTDVLITHGPPHGVLDQVRGGSHLGCEELAARVAAVRPRIHVFGHIHDGFGVLRSQATVFINASTCDADRHILSRVIRGARRRVVTVIRGKDEEVIRLKLLIQSPQRFVEPLKRATESLRVISMPEKHVEVFKVGVNKPRVRFHCLPQRHLMLSIIL